MLQCTCYAPGVRVSHRPPTPVGLPVLNAFFNTLAGLSSLHASTAEVAAAEQPESTPSHQTAADDI
jgi:hypothetical protein